MAAELFSTREIVFAIFVSAMMTNLVFLVVSAFLPVRHVRIVNTIAAAVTGLALVAIVVAVYLGGGFR